MSPYFKFKPQGKVHTTNGIEWQHTLPMWQRPLYRATVWIQYVLWRCGIPWHNWLADECTPNFNCCWDKCTPDEQAILLQIANSETCIEVIQ